MLPTNEESAVAKSPELCGCLLLPDCHVESGLASTGTHIGREVECVAV